MTAASSSTGISYNSEHRTYIQNTRYRLRFYSGTWPSYLPGLLSIRLVVAIDTRNYARRSFSEWALRMTKTPGSLGFDPRALSIELYCYLCVW